MKNTHEWQSGVTVVGTILSTCEDGDEPHGWTLESCPHKHTV